MNLLKRLVRRIVPKSLVRVLEKSYRWTRGLLWQVRYGFPARGMKVVAISGTNGKSTTAAFLNEIFKASGQRTAVLTTVFYEIAGVRESNRTHFTIDKQSIVQNFLYRAKKADVDWVILEVTSHALDQGRIMGVPVNIAVITNLTQDHLDYHGNMESYASAKARLLADYGAETAVLNADDKYFEYFSAKSRAKVFSFGKATIANAKIQGVKLAKLSAKATFAVDEQKLKLKTNLVGEFNLYNAAAAASAAYVAGVDTKAIELGVAKLASIDGRMEPVDAGQDFAVYVDFAITPDALEKALSSLQKTTTGKVRVVFGATGDRDKDKRPKMGEIAARYADFIYLTDDETYTEDPEIIREAVYAGIEQAGGAKKAKVIADREAAIRAAVNDAGRGDAVLLAGIGHETERNMGGKLIPWSEQEIARKAIKSRR